MNIGELKELISKLDDQIEIKIILFLMLKHMSQYMKRVLI